MATKYKLTYFNTEGRGEAIRLIFKHANIEFDDHRISFETFGAMKENRKLLQNSKPWNCITITLNFIFSIGF